MRINKGFPKDGITNIVSGAVDHFNNVSHSRESGNPEAKAE